MPEEMSEILRIRELPKFERDGFICYGETQTQIPDGDLVEPVMVSTLYDSNGNIVAKDIEALPYVETIIDPNAGSYPLLGGQGSDGEYTPISSNW